LKLHLDENIEASPPMSSISRSGRSVEEDDVGEDMKTGQHKEGRKGQEKRGKPRLEMISVTRCKNFK
jgi:hypothetical protein